jgi:hypothetical protein
MNIRKIVTIFILCCAIAIPFIVVKYTGGSYSKIHDIFFPYSIRIHTSAVGATIIDENNTIHTISPHETLFTLYARASRDRLIAVMQKNHYPWQKTVSFLPNAGNTSIDVYPFNFPIIANETEIASSSSEWKSEFRRLASSSLPTRDAPLVSDDGATIIFADNGTIMSVKENQSRSYTIRSETSIFTGQQPITSIAFLDDSGSSIIFSVDTGVYALDTDQRNTQNFQPIWKGINPRARIDNGIIYIHDSERILRINQ